MCGPRDRPEGKPVTAPDPDELLRQLDPGLAELKERAERAQQELATANASSVSPDRSITVTVGPGGNLTGLTIADRAMRQDPARLAAQIMSLAGQAQRKAGEQVMAAFGDLVGADSPAMDVLTPFLPAPAEDEPGAGDPFAPPAPPPPPPPLPPQGRPPLGVPPAVPPRPVVPPRPAGPPPQQYGPPPRGPQPPPQPQQGPRRQRATEHEDDDPDFWKRT
jgi:DNA-binding protein YbaB